VAHLPRQGGERVDVESRDLPPAEEIAGLLKGARGVGLPGKVERVAVPPFRVLQNNGREASWVGEAAAEVLAAGLSGVDGVSVLERGELARLVDELRKEQGGEENAVKASTSGKLLGAQHLVLGSLLPVEGETYRLVVRPVRVEDGVVLPSVQVNLKVGAWESLRPVVDGVVAQLGLREPEGKALTPLSAEALEWVSKARELQSQGELVEAQKLYARALAEPSSAWRAEADYLLLMSELGMSEWVDNRARRVLEQMPQTAEVACDRARLMAQAARAKYRVDETRDAVRAAASCGDRAVIAQALGYLSVAVDANHLPTGLAALAAAQGQLGPGEAYGVTRCWLRVQEESRRNELQGEDDGGERWEKIGRYCGEVGVPRSASFALRSAAFASVDPAQRKRLFEVAIEQAKKAGGVALDWSYIEASNEERRLGHIVKADELLLAQMASRMSALVELSGGLGELEGRLDHELLARMGAKPVFGSAPTDEPTQLQLRIHRRGLASGLRQWAARTRTQSQRQGAFYDEVAAALDPPPTPEPTQAKARFEHRMAAAKLSLSQIAHDERPLRGSEASLSGAFRAISDYFWALRGEKVPVEQLTPLVQAAKTTAGWRDHPRDRFNALRMEAELRDLEGARESALGLLRGASGLVKSSWARDTLLVAQAEIVGRQDHEQAAAFYDQAAAVVEKSSPSTWVARSYSREWHRIAARKGSDGAQVLLKIAASLEERGLIEPAAQAMYNAASLHNRIAEVARPVAGRLARVLHHDPDRRPCACSRAHLPAAAAWHLRNRSGRQRHQHQARSRRRRRVPVGGDDRLGLLQGARTRAARPAAGRDQALLRRQPGPGLLQVRLLRREGQDPGRAAHGVAGGVVLRAGHQARRAGRQAARSQPGRRRGRRIVRGAHLEREGR
jgi:tetratricopeptide (TPR) repeat protein